MELIYALAVGVFCTCGVWLLLRGLDRWLIAPRGMPDSAAVGGHMQAGVLAIIFALLLVVVSEPFLLQAAPLSEFRLRLPVLVLSPETPAAPHSEPTKTMPTSTFLTIGIFAALQIAVYLACLLKIREVSRHPVSPLVKTGKLRLLAVTSLQPSALAPGVPTVAATGLPGFEVVNYTSAVAPAKTPPAVISRLTREMVRVRHQPEVKPRLLNAAMEPVASSPEEMAVVIKAYLETWAKVMKDAGIKAE